MWERQEVNVFPPKYHSAIVSADPSSTYHHPINSLQGSQGWPTDFTSVTLIHAYFLSRGFYKAELGEKASHLCSFTKFENLKLAIFSFTLFHFLFAEVYLNAIVSLLTILVYFKTVTGGSFMFFLCKKSHPLRRVIVLLQ